MNKYLQYMVRNEQMNVCFGIKFLHVLPNQLFRFHTLIYHYFHFYSFVLSFLQGISPFMSKEEDIISMNDYTAQDIYILQIITQTKDKQSVFCWLYFWH